MPTSSIFDNELSPAQLRNFEKRRPQGPRSHATHPRHLRAARADARRQAAGRAGAAQVPDAEAGRRRAQRCRALAAASARAGLVKPNWKPTGAASVIASASCRGDRRREAPPGAVCAIAGRRPPCRPSRSSATPMPARRRCSTADRVRRGRVERALRDARSARSPHEAAATAASCSCRTRSDSSSGCRTRLSRLFARRSRKWRRPTCSVHVIDASNPERDRQIAAVRTVLAEVGADEVPMLDAYNKCDSLDEGERGRLRAVSPPGALCISALTGDGRDDLIASIAICPSLVT